MAFDGDLALFFSSSEFAESATLTPPTGDPLSLTVQFMRADVVGNQWTGEAQDSSHYLLAVSSDLSTLTEGQLLKSTVVVGGLTLKVVAVSPDGTGLTRLDLYDKDETA